MLDDFEALGYDSETTYEDMPELVTDDEDDDDFDLL